MVKQEVVLKHAKAWLLLHLFFGVILLPVLGLGLIIIIWTLLKYSTESFTLRKNSILVKRGVLSRTDNEIPVSKVNNINTYKNLLGMLLNYGKIGIYSANATEPEVFSEIADPERVKAAIKARMDLVEGSPVKEVQSKGPVRRFE